MAILISPTEPEFFRQPLDARISSKPEQHGVDFLWWAPGGKRMGVQRKRFPDDFLASLHDGRLAKEIQQMNKLDVKCLVVEGYGTWTTDDELINHERSFKLGSFYGLLASFQILHDIKVWQVRDHFQTITMIQALHRWGEKTDHSSLQRRPGPRTDHWGNRSSEAWALHMLQSIDGVGPGLASKIYAMWGLPLRWTLDGPEQLEQVPGIGKSKAAKIWGALA